MMKQTPLVATFMVTYNHEKYIAQAIESVLMQKPHFSYVLYIGEDNSTDKTREICLKYQNKYPDKIKLFLNKNNLGPQINSYQLLQKCFESKAKYIALLEGDDYWTDPYKLQKQVDFLEKHQDYGLIHSDYNILYQHSNSQYIAVNQSQNKIIPVGYVYNELLLKNFIYTVTVLFRSFIIRDSTFCDSLLASNWLVGDWPMWLEISLKSKVGYIDESMATYRKHCTSITHYRSKLVQFDFIKSIYNMRLHFISKYGCDNKTRNAFDIDYHGAILHNCYYIKDRELARSAYHFLKSKAAASNITTIFEYLGVSIPVLWLLARIYTKIIIFFKTIIIKTRMQKAVKSCKF